MAKAPAAKPTFGAGVLSGLRQAASKEAGGGEPLTLLLDQIEEDPTQPRQVFSDAELEQMAETIRLLGVLSPIGVRKLEGERYALVYGARRLRGSRLAGKTRIPAIIVPAEQATLAAQVIENQARAGLANSDLAGAVNRLFADGMPVKQIAMVCNLKEYQVAAFRAADKLPPFLRSRLDEADMRALYDLSRVWEKNPEAIEAAMPADDVYLTITEARRVIEAATGKATGSVFLRNKEAQEPEAPAAPAPTAAEPEPEDETPSPRPTSSEDEAPAEPPLPLELPEKPDAPAPVSAPAPATRKPAEVPPAPAPAARGAPVFIMEMADGRRGVLVTHRRAKTKGSVLLDVQGDEFEAVFSELRPVDAD